MDCFLNLLAKWQGFIGPLIGALTGGIIGLLSALLVARDARKREERSAARLLYGDLERIKNSYAKFSNTYKTGEFIEIGKEMSQLIENLLAYKPSLSPLFESSMAQVGTIDKDFSEQLRLVYEKCHAMDQIFNNLQISLNAHRQGGNIRLKTLELKSYADQIKTYLGEAAEHSESAEKLINRLILR